MDRKNLWAPWRINYIQELGKEQECFLCTDVAQQDCDEQNLVVLRTDLSVVVLNKYPYNNGHLLVAPVRHIAELDQADDNELLDMMRLIRICCDGLRKLIKPDGFNIGINIGRCAGAGLPGHIHIHIVPRWQGDTNFMSVCGDTDVISQSLQQLWKGLKDQIGGYD